MGDDSSSKANTDKRSTHTRSKARRQTRELPTRIRMSAAAAASRIAHQPLPRRRASYVGTAEERTQSTQAQTWSRHRRRSRSFSVSISLPVQLRLHTTRPVTGPIAWCEAAVATRATAMCRLRHMKAWPPPQALPTHPLRVTPSAASHGVGARHPSEAGSEGRVGYVRVPLDTSPMT